MLDDLDTRESHIRVRQLVDECLTEREADIIRQRYGLGGKAPRTQRELAAEYGISRSYVSRRAVNDGGSLKRLTNFSPKQSRGRSPCKIRVFVLRHLIFRTFYIYPPNHFSRNHLKERYSCGIIFKND